MKRTLFGCALVLIARASLALDPARAISQYGHTAWRKENGVCHITTRFPVLASTTHR